MTFYEVTVENTETHWVTFDVHNIYFPRYRYRVNELHPRKVNSFYKLNSNLKVSQLLSNNDLYNFNNCLTWLEKESFVSQLVYTYLAIKTAT